MVSVETATSAQRTILKADSWAVAWTKSHHEWKLQEYLLARDVPSFLPVLHKRRIYGRHVRESEQPLFSSYVFFDSAAISRMELFESRRITEILKPQDPEQLRNELLQLSIALEADGALRESRFGRTGTPVQVTRGIMKGLVGELVRLTTESRLIIRISFLGKAAELAIDEAYVEPLQPIRS